MGALIAPTTAAVLGYKRPTTAKLPRAGAASVTRTAAASGSRAASEGGTGAYLHAQSTGLQTASVRLRIEGLVVAQMTADLMEGHIRALVRSFGAPDPLRVD